MKPQEIDQLFRDKLVKHSETPKQASWQELNNRLQQNKKRKGMVYWRVAAAVLLLLSAIGFLLYTPATTEQHIAQVEQKTEEKADGPEVHQEKESETPLIVPEEALALEQTEKAKPQPEIHQPVKQSRKTQQAAQLASAEQHVSESTPAVEEIVVPVQEIPTLDEQALAMGVTTPEVTPQPIHQAKAREEVIIEYKPSGGKSVTLLAASHPADEDDDESGSRVGKFLKKVKNTEIDLISLREAKDELIAARLQP